MFEKLNTTTHTSTILQNDSLSESKGMFVTDKQNSARKIKLKNVSTLTFKCFKNGKWVAQHQMVSLLINKTCKTKINIF